MFGSSKGDGPGSEHDVKEESPRFGGVISHMMRQEDATL